MREVYAGHVCKEALLRLIAASVLLGPVEGLFVVASLLLEPFLKGIRYHGVLLDYQWRFAVFSILHESDSPGNNH